MNSPLSYFEGPKAHAYWIKKDPSVPEYIESVARRVAALFSGYAFFEEKGNNIAKALKEGEYSAVRSDDTVGLALHRSIYAPQEFMSGEIRYYGLMSGTLFHYLAFMKLTPEKRLWQDLLALSHPASRNVVNGIFPDPENTAGRLNAVLEYGNLSGVYAHQLTEALKRGEAKYFERA